MVNRVALSRHSGRRHRGSANRPGETALSYSNTIVLEMRWAPANAECNAPAANHQSPFTFHPLCPLSPLTFHPRPLSLLTYVPAGMTGWLSSSAGGHLGF